MPYIDVGTFYGVTPFVGAGIGGAFNRIYGLTDIGVGGTNAGFGYAPDKTKVDLAYAGMVGLSLRGHAPT